MAEKSERTDGRDDDLKRPAQGIFATRELVTVFIVNVGKYGTTFSTFE